MFEFVKIVVFFSRHCACSVCSICRLYQHGSRIHVR